MRSSIVKIGASILVILLALASTGCINDPPEQSGVFTTRDGGVSWNAAPDLKAEGARKPKVYPPLAVNAVAASPESADRVLAGTSDDIFQTTDGGANWERLTGKLPTANKAMTVQAISYHPRETATFFVGGVSAGYGKLIRSRDNGGSLQDVFTVSKPGQSVTAIAVDPNGVVYVGDQLGSVYRSTDEGDTWQRVFSLSTAVTSVVLSGPNIFVGTNGQGVWRSTNQGAAFSPVNAGLAGKQLTVWRLAVGFGGLYAGTEQGLLVTRNHGDSWQPIGNPLPAGGQRIQAIAVSGPSLYFATNAVVYRMSPDGSNFSPVQLKLARNVFSLSSTVASTGTLYAGANSEETNFGDQLQSGLPGLNVKAPGL